MFFNIRCFLCLNAPWDGPRDGDGSTILTIGSVLHHLERCHDTLHNS